MSDCRICRENKKNLSQLLCRLTGKPRPSSPAVLCHHTQLLSSPSLWVCWQGKQMHCMGIESGAWGSCLTQTLRAVPRHKEDPGVPICLSGAHSHLHPPAATGLALGNTALCVQQAGEPPGGETQPASRPGSPGHGSRTLAKALGTTGATLLGSLPE